MLHMSNVTAREKLKAPKQTNRHSINNTVFWPVGITIKYKKLSCYCLVFKTKHKKMLITKKRYEFLASMISVGKSPDSDTITIVPPCAWLNPQYL